MNQRTNNGDGGAEIRTALGESRRLFVSIGLFSAFVNLLMLTGPLFMLQVYDRVLGAILTRAGLSPAARSAPATGLADLEAMQRFASGPGPFAFFDAPWTPVFLFVLFTFHWLLGVLAVVSGVLLLVLALLNSARTARLQNEAGEAAAKAGHFIEQIRAGGETVRGLGMREAATARSGVLRGASLKATMAASDRGGAYAVTSRTLRLFLQSLMLGLGAWLAIRGEVTPGIMIAASILLGRALAPIDQAVGQWPMLQRALTGRRSLVRLLSETPEEPVRTPLPVPQALLEAENLVVAAPGAKVPAVRGVSFRVEPGRAIGIAGPSASGKSTLAKALAGVWPPAAGKVTLGGAALDQYGEAALAAHVGWLPQEVVLFEGSVAENIARLAPSPDPGAVVAAAEHAGAHAMILDLPGGYDFQVAAGGAALSGGQRQRIALVRSFYGVPAVVILDEPDASLDTAGSAALNRAVAALKARGGSAVIVAHRPGAFQECDVVYLMESGQARPVGPGDAVPPRAVGETAGATAGAVPVRAVRVALPPGFDPGPPGTPEGPLRVVKTPPPDRKQGPPRDGGNNNDNGA